ncbi:MAG: hypothetical protein GXO69_10905 [Acidobacteria bacterium]|nr:hypothetical protein [Acidobacteriota bacterium]
MGWKELVVSEIDSAPNRVVELNLKAGTIRYSGRIRQNLPIHRLSDDSELVRAYMVHRFVNVMGYAPEALELDRPYLLGRQGDDVTVGIVVRDEDGNPFFFASAAAPDKFDEGDDTKSRLFLAAEKEFDLSGKVVRHLLYFTVRVENERLVHDSVLIDYFHFHRMSDWDRAEKVPFRGKTVHSDVFRRFSRGKRKVCRARYNNYRFLLFLNR